MRSLTRALLHSEASCRIPAMRATSSLRMASRSSIQAQRTQRRRAGQFGASRKSRAVLVGAPLSDRTSQLLPFTCSLHGRKCNVKTGSMALAGWMPASWSPCVTGSQRWPAASPVPTECSVFLLCEGVATPDGEPEVGACPSKAEGSVLCALWRPGRPRHSCDVPQQVQV